MAAGGARERQIREANGAITGDIDDTTVSVARKEGEFSQITMEMKELMIREEYRSVVEAQHSAGDDRGDVYRKLSEQEKKVLSRSPKQNE